MPEGGFPAAVADGLARLGDHPMPLGGMVGSSRGSAETDYVAAPSDLSAVAAGALRPPEYRTVIAPGVSQVEGIGRR